MLKKHLILSLLATLLTALCYAQNNKDQLEEMRKLQKQMQEENKMIQQQQEWNNQSSQQEIKKLNAENQQKTFEVQSSKQEAAKARQDAIKAKAELESKMIELAATQIKIDSAKRLLAYTDSMLQTAEVTNKRIMQEKQRQEDSIKILNKDRELQDLAAQKKDAELSAQKAKNNLYILIAAISLSMLTIVVILFFSRQKTLRELAEKNRVIQEEKKRSDELLLNILPEEIMHELKARGKTQARNFSNATVLFADIKEFTKISERLSPDELIEALDAYFERFDNVIEKYGIEKIKTIGDAYVCAGGVPSKNEVGADAMVKAALEFMQEIEKLRVERTKKGLQTFEFRLGMHTGQLIAGVIGIRKFAYDIWGDTVNMAARMQQESEAGKINISGATYELVKDKFACVYRGKHAAKNKGDIDMYFVEKAIA
ncbi:MAG: adenylate/guanylate cyclase domain-containing protein [Chitinophagales bacterium]